MKDLVNRNEAEQKLLQRLNEAKAKIHDCFMLIQEANGIIQDAVQISAILDILIVPEEIMGSQWAGKPSFGEGTGELMGVAQRLFDGMILMEDMETQVTAILLNEEEDQKKEAAKKIVNACKNSFDSSVIHENEQEEISAFFVKNAHKFRRLDRETLYSLCDIFRKCVYKGEGPFAWKKHAAALLMDSK